MLNILKIIKLVLSKREMAQLFILLAAIIVMSLFQALSVASVMPFISLVINPEMVFENKWLYWFFLKLDFNSTSIFTFALGLGMLGIIIIANASSAYATWLNLRFVWMNNHRLSRRLLKKYLSMPYDYFLNKSGASLSNNVLSEVNKITHLSIMPLLVVVSRGIVVIFILVILFWIDISVSLIAIGFFGGVYVIIYKRFNQKLKKSGDELLIINRLRYEAVIEAMGGIKAIKAMNREQYFLEKYSKQSLKHAYYESTSNMIGQLPRFALEAIAFGGIIIFVLFLLLTSEDTSRIIPVTGLFAFAGYRLLPALQEIFNSYANIKYSQAVVKKVYHDLTLEKANMKIQAFNIDKEIKPIILQREIRLRGITYNYPGAVKPALYNINLSIPSKSSVAFVGPTGGGKTTLADILIGLLFPQEGLIFIDDLILDQTNLFKWQCNIGYVPQHIFLTDDTVSNNIAFGIPEKNIDHQRIERVARIANIEQFINKELSDGYNTKVGEKGIRLSGGQLQRIGIARALYHDPAVLLFDEATSALDGSTEEGVLTALKNTASLKTLIIIAHRLTTVKDCDQIVVIDRGQIAAIGKYDELLLSNRQFQKMAKVKT
jgi:ATP-binding cassette, subfamily B, bacterial PglK